MASTRLLWGALLTAVLAVPSYILLSVSLCPPGTSDGATQGAGHETSAPGRTLPFTQPNFVIIMTDDQGDMLDDTREEVMPSLHQQLIKQGQRFLNYFVTTPICCPSRVSFYRAQYETNHNYTDVLGVEGGGVAGYSKFKDLKVDDSYLPTWLQSLGYNTYLSGKFIVDYNVRNYHNPPKGWTDIDALVTPYLFQYYDPVFSRNGDTPRRYPGMYSTDVVAAKALAQIQAGVAAGRPFFVQINPIAPHFSSGGPTSPLANGSTVPGDVSVPHYPPLPAPRHWRLFNDLEVPKPFLSFNEEDVSDKPAWIRSLSRLSATNITFLEEVYRNRLRSLRAVDELIDRVVRQLEQLGVLNNTYVIFTSDNGYHMGQHRRATGKLSAYEEDIRVPFAIRGPGLKPNTVVLKQCAHIDIGPTLLALAGAKAPEEVDGHPLPLVWATADEDRATETPSDTGDGPGAQKTSGDSSAATPPGHTLRPMTYPDTDSASAPTRTQFSISYFAGGNGDFDEYFRGVGGRIQNNNWTWKSIRVHDPDYQATDNLGQDITARAAEDDGSAALPRDNDRGRLFPLQPALKYSILCTNEQELYDLHRDPRETDNLLLSSLSSEQGHNAVETTTGTTHIHRGNSSTAAARRMQETDVLPPGNTTGSAPSSKHLHRLHKRLDVLFQVLHACWGRSCRYPFQIIHNDTETPVHSVWESLRPQYDDVYDQVPWFRFLSCQRYQDYDNELNHFRKLLGTFPRGRDGVSLAVINITWAHDKTPAHAAPRTAAHHNSAAGNARPTSAAAGTHPWLQQPCRFAGQLRQVQQRLLSWVCSSACATSQQMAAGQGPTSAAGADRSSVDYWSLISDFDRQSVPLTHDQLDLTALQLYGPPGAHLLLA